MVQETYSLLFLDEDVGEDRTADTRYAPLDNILTAAVPVTSLFVAQAEKTKPSTVAQSPIQDRSSLSATCAIVSGFSVQLRGSRQSTRDIDILTSINMKGVWEAITGDERYTACSLTSLNHSHPLISYKLCVISSLY